jgi:hypothetical protein
MCVVSWAKVATIVVESRLLVHDAAQIADGKTFLSRRL